MILQEGGIKFAVFRWSNTKDYIKKTRKKCLGLNVGLAHHMISAALSFEKHIGSGSPWEGYGLVYFRCSFKIWVIQQTKRRLWSVT